MIGGKEENNYQFSYQDDGKIEKINMAVTASDEKKDFFLIPAAIAILMIKMADCEKS